MAQQFNNIKWVIFDFDGVVGHANQKHLLRLFCSDLHVSESVIRTLMDARRTQLQTNARFQKKFWSELSKTIGRSDADQLEAKWKSYYSVICALDFRLLDYINTLKSRYGICILSNTSSLYRVEALESIIDLYFEKKYWSYELGFRKPNEKIYRYIISDLNANPKECMFIDNLDKNLVSPEQLGAKTFKYDKYEAFKSQMNLLLEKNA